VAHVSIASTQLNEGAGMAPHKELRQVYNVVFLPNYKKSASVSHWYQADIKAVSPEY
jgi:hypothetical protein